MSENPVIVLGDTTTHGGKVITAHSLMSINDIPVALVGDLVECPRCKGVYPIVQGSGSASLEEKPVARQGDLTGCGAALISVVQSSVTIP
jgi:uncharacterized Zn-binding protein involved in type VI secretion